MEKSSAPKAAAPTATPAAAAARGTVAPKALGGVRQGDLELPVTHRAKIIIVGDSGVGKTSYIQRCIGNPFSGDHIATIGVDFSHFSLRSPIAPDEALVEVYLWDIAGQDRFAATFDNMFRGLHAIVLMFDITNADSLASLQWRWLARIVRGLRLEDDGNDSDGAPSAAPDKPAAPPPVTQAGSVDEASMAVLKLKRLLCASRMPLVVIGSKLDLVEETPSLRKVASETGITFARSLDAAYVESSSKSQTSEDLGAPLRSIIDAIFSDSELAERTALPPEQVKSRAVSRFGTSAASLRVLNGTSGSTPARARTSPDCCS
jgi:GTPase SAR1 family protein